MTKLEQHVLKWISDKSEDYNGDKMAVLKDLGKGGCISGYVNHLIYSNDYQEFVKEHMNDIQDIINDIEEETGDRTFLFGKGLFSFDRLAWLAFEHTAFQIMHELESEAA